MIYIFSYFVGCLFTLLKVSSAAQKFYILNIVQFISFSLVTYAFGDVYLPAPLSRADICKRLWHSFSLNLDATHFETFLSTAIGTVVVKKLELRGQTVWVQMRISATAEWWRFLYLRVTYQVSKMLGVGERNGEGDRREACIFRESPWDALDLPGGLRRSQSSGRGLRAPQPAACGAPRPQRTQLPEGRRLCGRPAPLLLARGFSLTWAQDACGAHSALRRVHPGVRGAGACGAITGRGGRSS